ncbi:MAG TPA: hypothetical protein VHB54_20795 [Mucilaginibacter sp.]|nr:hypothetical protein [Mucilaginibacter sp.]
MKPVIPFLLFFTVAYCTHAQSTLIYLDKNFQPVTDSAQAATKVLLSKYAEDTTLWKASQYDMINNQLMVEGVYKDAGMTVPNGPFKYYFNGAEQHILMHSGYFINGARYGEWIDYFADGSRMKLQTFRNNELNGPYLVYNMHDSIPTVKGFYLKGKKNGEWITASEISIYQDGVLKESIPNKEYEKQNAEILNAADKIRRRHHIISAIEPVNFSSYLQQKLSSYFRNYVILKAGTAIVLTFTVTEQGRLINGRSVTNVSDAVQQQVARAIDSAPYWTPAEANGKPISQRINYTFTLDNIRLN